MIKALNSNNRLAAFFAVLISIILLLTSFYETDPEVYLFPRITAVFIAFLSIILSYDAFTQKIKHDQKFAPLINWKDLLPGLMVGIIYVLLLERVGFYICSFITFFAICMIYGKRSLFDRRAFMLKLMVTTITMIVLYLLFWKLLNVRTPTGILF